MLTDREKLIIATLVIKRQNKIKFSPAQKEELVQKYSVALDVPNKRLFWLEMGKEQRQYVQMLTDIKSGLPANFDGIVSEFNNREKYIYYNVEMMCTLNLPFQVHFCFKEIMRKLLYNQDDEELLLAIKYYTDTILAFCRMMENHKF